MPTLDPADLRRFAQRDWSELDDMTREARAKQDMATKSRLAVSLYEAARETRPDWPSDETRWADLLHHERVCALLARAAHVGAR